MAIKNVGINTELTDENLQPQAIIPDDSILIIDRAFSGPSNVLFPIGSDLTSAKVLFGEQSPIIQQANHAIAGGATSLVLYRIGGAPAELVNVLGEYSSIRTVAETVGAGQNLSLYIGPQPNNNSKSCIIVKKGDKIVYSNVLGSAINTGEVIIEGFDEATQPYRVGSLTNPTPFSQVVAELLDSIIQVETATVGQTLITLGTPVPTATSNLVVSLTNTSGTTTLALTTDYTVTSSAGNVVSITLVNPAIANDVYTLSYTKPTDNAEKIANEIAYTAGKNSLGISLNSLYELYDSAFEELDNVNVVGATIQDLFNCRNIAAGDDASSDRLTYVKRTEEEIGFSYEWSTDKYLYQLQSNSSLTTTDPQLAAIDDNGQPIISKQFHEVDFTHRLGVWAYINSTESKFIHTAIGPVAPKATSALAIKRYIGTAPTKDIYGKIIQNGTGLLGNRFMAGTVVKLGGFYLTDTGYPDGNILTDSKGAVVDLGKYISIPVNSVYLNSDLLVGKTVPVTTSRSFAPAYVAMVNNVRVGDSTTNLVVPFISPLFVFKESVANELSTTGYVALVSKPKGITIYSGDLATRSTSDYSYVSTAIAVAYVVRRLETIIDPYLGKGIDLVLGTALNNAIDMELKFAANSGAINGYDFDIKRVGPNRLAIALVLVPKDELRQVSVTIALNRDTTFVLE